MSDHVATVRVYLVTYRRPLLLRRALASLLAQTRTDWVCELHNDDPADPAPESLVRELADSRIRLCQHERNLGPITTFNLAHAGAPEPYFSLLEDDNWWEPCFLARMIETLESSPAVSIAWANMTIWKERPDGWHNTLRTIWPIVGASQVSLAWPQLLQFDGPLHSNGAMLGRAPAAAGGRLQVPSSTPFDVIENLRERAFTYPILLVPEPLANFAHTLQTARPSQPERWLQSQVLLGAAFLKHVKLTTDDCRRLWDARRAAVPPATAALFFAGLLQWRTRYLIQASVADWLRFIAGCFRHPRVALAALRARQRLPDVWAEVDRATAAACARAQGVADIPPRTLSCRADLARVPFTATKTPRPSPSQ